MVKHIIFDVMGVVFVEGDDTGKLLIPYIQSLLPEISADTIGNIYLKASLGQFSSNDFWLKLGFAENKIRDIEQHYLNTCFKIDDAFIPCIRRLKNRYDLSLLSNDISEWSAYLRQKYGIDKLIERAFISGDLGLRKPNPEIYRKALELLKAAPKECVFIDDDPARVDAAAKLGINAILFNRLDHRYEGRQIFSFHELEDML